MSKTVTQQAKASKSPLKNRLKDAQVALTFIFLAVVWGSSFILMKKALLAFSPAQIAGLRIVIAGMVLVPFSYNGFRQVKRKAWIPIILVGLIGNAIPAFLFPLAETHINSATAGILNVLSPLFALVFGFFLFNTRFTRIKVLGVLIGLAGAVMLIAFSGQDIELGTHIKYAMLVILATAGYGMSVNLMKNYLSDTPSRLASAYALQAMAIPYGIYLLFTGLPAVFRESDQAWLALGYIAILAILGTAIALILFYRLVKLTDAVVSASVTYMIPVVAVFWGLIDGETLSLWQWVGMAVVLGGVYLVNRR